MLRREIIVALTIIVAAAWYYWQATFLPTKAADPLGPARYPQLLALAVIVFALLHILVSYFRRHRLAEDEEEDTLTPPQRRRGDLRIVAVVVATAAYAFVMEPLGFSLTTFFYMLALALILGVRSVVGLAATSFGITISLVLLFVKFLGVLVPVGFIEELLLR